MANAVALQNSGPNHATYRMTGDGTVAGPVRANAAILAELPVGPLRDLFAATYADQAAMRTALLEGNPGVCLVQMRATVNDVTAEQNQVSVDVDVDAVTATQPEINFTMSDTTGQVAYCTFLHLHSIIR